MIESKYELGYMFADIYLESQRNLALFYFAWDTRGMLKIKNNPCRIAGAPDSKKHPGNAFCLYSNAGGTRNRRRCGQMYQSTDVLAVVGARPRREQGSVEGWISRIFFVCLTFSALDRWGKKTDISLSCPMSRGAKQDLPSVRRLSVVFLSANEFWKSENSREKVHTRCALGFMSVLYTFFMKIASLHLMSNLQEMGDS